MRGRRADSRVGSPGGAEPIGGDRRRPRADEGRGRSKRRGGVDVARPGGVGEMPGTGRQRRARSAELARGRLMAGEPCTSRNSGVDGSTNDRVPESELAWILHRPDEGALREHVERRERLADLEPGYGGCQIEVERISRDRRSLQ